MSAPKYISKNRIDEDDSKMAKSRLNEFIVRKAEGQKALNLTQQTHSRNVLRPFQSVAIVFASCQCLVVLEIVSLHDESHHSITPSSLKSEEMAAGSSWQTPNPVGETDPPVCSCPD